jgi:tight adherence protein B
MPGTALVGALAVLLGACSAGGLLLAILYPRMAADSLLDKRVERIASTRSIAPAQADAADESRHQRSAEAILREAEEELNAHAKRRHRPSLRKRMRQAGMAWNTTIYYLVCGASGLIAAALVLSLGLGMLAAICFGTAVGVGLPHWYIGFQRSRRFKRFASEFPNALDFIVRGVKSGLPLVDCLRSVAANAQEPVKSEFRTLIADQALGMPPDEAVQRLSDRMPLPDVNFFAMVIAMQSRTGGSLSEALTNLSGVLRERRKMEGKVQALSGEVRASAIVIGALPVVFAAVIYLTTPAYISLLFTTEEGKIVLATCGVLMTSGILMMRKIINFEV